MSLTRLPASFLTSLSGVAHPDPPHPFTLLPVSLYKASLDPRSIPKKEQAQIKPPRSLHVMTRAPLLQYLATTPRELTSYASHALKAKTVVFPQNPPKAIDTLMAGAVVRALAWPLKRSNPNFAVPLNKGPDALNK